MDQAEQLRNVIKKKSREASAGCARVLTITSGKGGVGKSNVAVNMAVWLRRMERKVIIIDADLGLANVEVMFGAVPQYNLSDLIYRGKSIREIITKGPMDIGFISGGLGIAGLNNLSKDQIVYLVHSLAELNEMADVIIIDTGAGISDSVLEFVLASPEILLVSTPEPSSLTDAYSLLKALYRNPIFSRDKTKINVIANKVTSIEEGDAVFSKLNSVVSQFLKGTIDFMGMIPQDQEMEHAVRSQKIVSIEKPSAEVSKAFQILTNNFINHKHETITMHKGIAQIIINFLARKGI
ncbi:flagellum site-determining protein YlxH [Lachnospiraceae bacterium]|jgi:flagellar biosynthesis protein FlhG|nr:MinD/ParA family protein [Eubacterium sp.]GFI28184.1 flagellum site-determining protein YlxH [Lachnospiraceae bacterium]